MEKILSIIVPCHNVENNIERCFECIVRQSIGFDNMELIFVDDASTDNTLSKLMEYEQQYPDNIIIVQFESCLGAGAARNAALDYASAPYIGYVDSDDWIELNMFEKMISCIQQCNCDFVACGWDLAYDDTHHFSIRKQGQTGFYSFNDQKLKDQFIETHIGDTALWNKIFKRSFLLDNDIFCLEQPHYEDIFFSYMAFIHADSCFIIDDVLYHYHYTQTPDRSSEEYHASDMMNAALSFLQICRNNVSLYTDNKDRIDWLFLERYYVYNLWEIFKKSLGEAYAYYSEIKKTILTEVPGFITIPFRFREGNAFDDIMLKLLDIELTASSLTEICNKLLTSFKCGGNVTLPTSFEATNRYYSEKSISDIIIGPTESLVQSAGSPHILFCRWNSVCDSGIVHGFMQLGYHIEIMSQYLENMNDDMNYYDALSDRLTAEHFDCVFSLNFLPIVSRCCNDLHIPYVCWTIDNPVNELYSNEIHLPWNRLFYFDRSQFDKFAPRNPKNSFYMPLACDHTYLNSISSINNDHRIYDCDISFIGSTYAEKCEYDLFEASLPAYTRGYINGIIQAQLNVYGYNFIEDSLSDGLCKEFADCCSLDQINLPYKEDIKTIIADRYIGQKCTEQDRIITLSNISENYNLDLYTTSDTSAFPSANCRGSVDYNTVMPVIFKCSKINLNMTSRSIRTGIPLRIFDIMGAGGFLLTNYQSELPDFFEIGKDLAVYDSQDDLLDQIEYYLTHDDERKEIALNGENKVKKYHTYMIKLEKIIKTALYSNT